jgi:hypothetical protein
VAIGSLDALAIVIAPITRLLKLSLFFLLSAARFADARDASCSHSLEAAPAKAFRAAFMRFDSYPCRAASLSSRWFAA